MKCGWCDREGVAFLYGYICVYSGVAFSGEQTELVVCYFSGFRELKFNGGMRNKLSISMCEGDDNGFSYTLLIYMDIGFLRDGKVQKLCMCITNCISVVTILEN